MISPTGISVFFWLGLWCCLNIMILWMAVTAVLDFGWWFSIPIIMICLVVWGTTISAIAWLVGLI